MSQSQSQGMVDISEKSITKRVAIAQAVVTLPSKAFLALLKKESPKGDVLEAAKIAGILAAKWTPTLIPHCHPLALKKVKMTILPVVSKRQLQIRSEVVCVGQTGVEMEALTAASVAALTVYDMMKWADKGIVISETRLLEKSGGKSGDYQAKV